MRDIILAIILGGLFGYALYQAGAADPRRLQSMLRLENLTLMKIILFAIGFASVLLAISIGIGLFDITHIHIKAVNMGVLLGGILFGFGFGWAGTCPGTCVAATGTGGFRKGIAAVVGGLTGAFAFSITYEYWNRLGLFNMLDLGKLTLFDITDKYPSVFNFGFIGLLIVGVLFMAAALVIPLHGVKGH